MDGCEHPKCHERIQLELKDKVSYKDFSPLKKCVNHKVSKKATWIIFSLVGLPLLITGVKVWSEQNTDPLRYATRDELANCNKNIAETKVLMKRFTEDLKDLKRGQEESRKDTKEILRYLREK